MNFDIIKKYSHELLLLITIILFVCFKIPYLNLSFYWDEAWVYGPAIQSMSENGPSLLPDSLPVDYSRGHPLLFHFLGGIWGVIFGNGKFALHVFALSLSVGLIITTFVLVRDVFNKKVAFLCAFALCLQPVFLAQSGLILPEVALALFTLFTIYFYFKKKWFWYFVFCASTIMIKESGLVVLFSTVAHYKLMHLNLLKSEPINFVKRAFLLASPILPWIIFLFIQKQQNGWYFFPEHVGLLSFDFGTIMNKLENYAAYLFIYQGRKFLLLAGLIGLIIVLLKKRKIEHWDKQLFFVIFIVGFLIFSSFNFFSNRYLMSLIVPVIILFIGSLHNHITKWYAVSIGIAFLSIVFYNTNKDLTNSDHNLGYANAVICHERLITYCVKNELFDKQINAYFLSREAMTKPNSGYIQQDQIFIGMTTDFNEKSEYIIFANFDTDDENMRLRDELDLTLIKRIEVEQAWAELYSVNRENSEQRP